MAAEAEELIVENLVRFDIGGSDHVLIACNTAHILVPALQRRTGIQFSSLIESVGKEVNRREISKIGILASPTSLKHNVHNLSGIEIIIPRNSRRIANLIREVVNGVTTQEQLLILMEEVTVMRRAGAEAILLGCAEIEMLLADDRDSCFIRPLELTIENMMRDIPNKL